MKLSNSRGLGGQPPPMSGPDFRKKTIGFPTSNAPFFISDLAKPWRIGDVTITPDKVLARMGVKNPKNDGCYRPQGFYIQ